jgi:hypothetical protein
MAVAEKSEIKLKVPQGVLLDGARMQLIAAYAGIAGFLKEKGIPFQEFVKYVGEKFEDSLGEFEGEEPVRAMEHLLALEVLPLGVDIVSSQTTDGAAEVTLTAFPSRELLEKFGTTPRGLLSGFGVTAGEMAGIYAMFEPAASAIGMRLTHAQKGGKQVLRLEKASRRR